MDKWVYCFSQNLGREGSLSCDQTELLDLPQRSPIQMGTSGNGPEATPGLIQITERLAHPSILQDFPCRGPLGE